MTAINRQDNFTKQFIHFTRHKTFSQTFADFLEIILCALSLGQQEERYFEVLKRYDEIEIKEQIPSVFAALQIEYLKNVDECGGWCDPLGEMFEEWGSRTGHKWLGQFFTPKSLSDLCAKITIKSDEINDRKTFNDPACGSGRMLIAAARMSPSMNLHGFYIGQDIDRTCAMMSAVNFFYHGMSGVVIHGDTLALKAWGGWRIRPLLARIDWLSSEQCMSYLLTSKNTIEKKNVNIDTNNQISLF